MSPCKIKGQDSYPQYAMASGKHSYPKREEWGKERNHGTKAKHNPSGQAFNHGIYIQYPGHMAALCELLRA
jgi:hypothetical protein